MIDKSKKAEILNQIDSFVNHQNSNKEPKRYELNFYVPTDIATDRALFFGHISKTLSFEKKKIIDLTFGSGNLTSHLLLDNDIDFETLVLNDKNIDDANLSDELDSIANITDNDILNSTSFDNQKYDLIVFNPQFGGGSYNNGDLGIKRLKEDEYITHRYDEDLKSAFSDKFDITDCSFSIDEDLKKISIHSENLSVGDMDKRFKKIKVFNYYDVFYQSKTSNPKGEESNLIKFRKTLEKISNENSTIVFFGKKSDYNLFFSDFNKCSMYIAQEIDKSLFIGKKDTVSSSFCYKKENSSFVEYECDEKKKIEFENIDIESVLNDIHSELSELKSLDGGDLFVLEDTIGINSENTKKTKEKPRFKNFLHNIYGETQ